MIVGVTGLKQAGKSMVSKHLEQARQFKVIPFAGPLKDMLMTLGLSYDQVYGSTKEVPDPRFYNKTPRQLMQWLGTEFGRKLIGEAVWVDAWARRAREAEYKGLQVVCDDLRFPNEAQRIKEMGGITIRIRRPATEENHADLHESEQHILTMPVDYEIINEEGQPAITYNRIIEILAPHLNRNT